MGDPCRVFLSNDNSVYTSTQEIITSLLNPKKDKQMEPFLVQGTYNTAKVFAKTVESEALEQIRLLCNQTWTKNMCIRVMPDVHVGAGCTIGTTMTITDTVVPNLVGVDIGCGMEVVRLQESNIDFSLLDSLIRERIPAGFNIRSQPLDIAKTTELEHLRCNKSIDLNRAALSIGTLGSGNHFIEVGRGDVDNALYLIVHSGSRHSGKQVAEFYQNIARSNVAKKSTKDPIPRGLESLTGADCKNYLHDMALMQNYADINRRTIVSEILFTMKLTPKERFSTVHNYIETCKKHQQKILRKGAVSAKQGERLLVPMNMRDGSLICVGKGNNDWNSSAPHGAGRLMSRGDAKRKLSMKDFKASMCSIFTTSVGPDTLDEAPQAYKPMDEIVRGMGDTVEIEQRIVPLYNFKA